MSSMHFRSLRIAGCALLLASWACSRPKDGGNPAAGGTPPARQVLAAPSQTLDSAPAVPPSARPDDQIPEGVRRVGITSPCVLHAGDSYTRGKPSPGDGLISIDCHNHTCSCSLRSTSPTNGAFDYSFPLADPCSTTEMAAQLLKQRCMVGLTIEPSPPVEEPSPQEWPQVKPGIWEIEANWTRRNGRPGHWKEKTSQCHQPVDMFQGYWGEGIVERGGCRSQSTKVSENEFKVTTECMVRHIGVATSEAVVTLTGDANFVMEVRHREGKRISKISHAGRWLSSCPTASQGAP